MIMNTHPNETPDHLPERIQYSKNPAFNSMQTPLREKIWHMLGTVTRPSTVKHGAEEGTTVERPLSEREQRSRIYNELKEERRKAPEARDQERIDALRTDAREADRISAEFLKQGTVEVDMGEMGTVAARYTELKGSEDAEQAGKAKIVFIPGISNDLECVDTICRALARSGRDVVVIGHPETYAGKATEAFANAVEKDPAYGPHAQFFEGALKQVVADGEEIELWGFSAGAPITADMLTDNPELSERVSKAVLLNPASSVKMSKFRLFAGIFLEETPRLLTTRRAPSYTMTNGFGDTVPATPDQKKLRDTIFGSMLQKTITPSAHWETMRVKEGGEISVIASDKDPMTRCYRAFNEKTHPSNPQMSPVITIKGTHNAPLVYPERVIERL